MHDAFGRPLEVGDRVMVPCKIKSVSSSLEYCNVSLETEASMPPYTNKDTITLNAKQVLRNNDGDSLDYTIYAPEGKSIEIVPAPKLPTVIEG